MIEYNDIIEANKLIKTTELKTKKGTKNYAEVPQRVKAFRSLFPNGTIETEIVHADAESALIKCTVSDGNGNKLATGHAFEEKSGSFINETSFVENCETSAVGRALGFLALGSDASIASYEEVANAVKTQDARKRTPEANKRVETPENASYDPPEMARLKNMLNNALEYRREVVEKVCNARGWRINELANSRYRMEEIEKVLNA